MVLKRSARFRIRHRTCESMYLAILREASYSDSVQARQDAKWAAGRSDVNRAEVLLCRFFAHLALNRNRHVPDGDILSSQSHRLVNQPD